VRRRVAIVAVVAMLAVVATACGGSGPAAAPSGGGEVLRVVTTTTILADLVRRVGGDRVTVESLVPKGGEVHTFDPTPSDVRNVAEADLVFVNGLGLDDWLVAFLADAGADAPVIRLGEDLAGVTYLTGGQGQESVNPHLWLNVAYAAKYAERIRDALTAADPGRAAEYRADAQTYAKVLADLDAKARTALGAIPVANRTVISFHDAFPYFAAAYGLTVDGTIVDSPGQDPSAAQVAELVSVIRDKGIKAIFAEAQFNEDLVRTIADETGATVVSSLYTDSVGDAPLDTYAGMMAWNIEQVARALSGG
jgi:manganese/iron transport system substrate-binding protein